MSRSLETTRHDSTTGSTTGAAAGAGGRMAGGERRQQILEVAMRLFSQRGFRGTTTKEIAAGAGVSEAMVFRHFANKDELYSAILDFKACSGGIEELRAQVADAISRKDDFAVFSGFARELMRHHESDTEFLRLLTHSALEGHELAEMFWDRNVRGLYEFLGGYVRERQREGAMRDVDPRIAVRAFVGAVIHHSLNNTLWDRRRTLLDISNERAADEFARILLEGVRTRERAAEKPKRPAATPRKKSKKRSGDK